MSSVRIDVSIAETGLAGTGAVGAESVTIDVSIAETGLAGTGGVGSVTATGGTGVTVSVTGVAGRQDYQVYRFGEK